MSSYRLRHGSWKYWIWLLALPIVSCRMDDASVAVGTLERERILLSAASDQTVLTVTVKQGDQVEAGEVLLQQDDAASQAREEALEAQLAQARAALQEAVNGPRSQEIDEARAHLEGATAQVSILQHQFDRIARLAAAGQASEQQRDDVALRLESARETKSASQSRLALLREGTRPEVLEQLKAAIDHLQAQLALERIHRRNLTLSAPMRGRVDSLSVHEGERPVPGQPLLTLLQGGAPFARLYIPESLRGKLALGETYELVLDGYLETHPGRLRFLSADPMFTPYYALTEKDRGHLVYLAEFDLVQPEDASLPAGLSVRLQWPSSGD